jgi:ABC-type branched-subunit amino acid transport system substrate-binding protein
MYSLCSIICIFILTNSSTYGDEQSRTIHIGALFDNDHPTVNHGQQDLQAAQIAIDEINRRRQELFHGLYTLTLLSNNSRVYEMTMI